MTVNLKNLRVGTYLKKLQEPKKEKKTAQKENNIFEYLNNDAKRNKR